MGAASHPAYVLLEVLEACGAARQQHLRRPDAAGEVPQHRAIAAGHAARDQLRA